MKKLALTLTLLLWAAVALATEQFKNLAATTTTGQTSGATTLVVASAALFPSTGSFTVGVDSGANYELERVTAVAGTTFTVTRGLSPTSAVAHSSGVAVVLVESAESFTQLEADAAASATIYCTDNWTPGSTTLTGGTTYTAGHTYCLNAPGTVTATGAQNINVANVTIACPSPGMIIQRTSTTQLFVVTAAGFRLMGCGIDGNTQTAAGTGPLVNLNGANDATIQNNIFTNTGTTASTQTGTIWVQAGLRDRIIGNTFSTSQTDTAIWVNSQSGTNTVSDLTIQDNKIPTMAPATNLYAIAVNQNTGNVSTRVKILDNIIALTNTHAEGIAFFGPAVVENTNLLGADVSGNRVTATAAVPRMVHLFGFDYGTIARNVIDDGGNIVSGAVLDLGDLYNTTVVGNEVSGRSATESGIVCIDCAEDTFSANTIDGIGNADPALQIGSNSAASSNNTITGNLIRMAFDGIGIEIQANGSGQPASFNTITGNTVIGNDKNNPSTGIEIVDTLGGAVGNTIESNALSGWGGTSNTCISVGSGSTFTYVGHNMLTDCTVSTADAGTNSTLDIWDGVKAITLSGGTGTATVPVPGIAAVGVCQDTTTASNKCTIAFTSSTTTATTVTATGTTTDHCTCTVQVH